jgi:hypothetical protein
MRRLGLGVVALACLAACYAAGQVDSEGWPESALLIDYNQYGVNLNAVATVADADRGYAYVVGDDGHFGVPPVVWTIG